VNPLRILTVYRWVFVALIVAASVAAIFASDTHAGHALLLATAEIAGALMLGIRRTQILGAALLMLVLVAAQVLSALQGAWSTHLLQYAASTMFIVLLERALIKTCN
jgi:hypothetical protein